MGAFALTKPGIQYQDPSIDPTTGMPINVPRTAFFPNEQARNNQYLKDTQSAVQNAPFTIDSNTGQPVIGTPNIPRSFRPSFASVAGPQAGQEQQINPAETKLGKLVHIVVSAARGAAYGANQPNFGAGFQAASTIPLQQAAERSQIQAQGLENQQRQAGLRMLPLDIAGRQAAIQAQQLGLQGELQRQRLAETGIKGTTYTRGTNGEMQLTPYTETGQTMPPIENVVNPFEMKPGVVSTINYQDPVTGQKKVGTLNKLSHDMIGQDGERLDPATTIWSEGLLPTHTSETKSMDLMGNTRQSTTKQAIQGRSAPNAQGISPGYATFPGARTTTQRPAGAQPGVRTGGGGAAAVRPPSGVMALPPDVEQRLAASGYRPNEQAYIRGLLNYQGQMPSPRSPNYAPTLAALTGIDPSFNAANYDIRKQMMTKYTSGSEANQINAINTALGHVGVLNDAVDALNNGRIPFLNSLANRLGVAVGKDPVTTFKTIVHRVGPELTTAYVQGGGGEGERGTTAADFSENLAPQQLKSNASITATLLRSKIDSLENQYKNTMGRQDFQQRFISPAASASMQRLTQGPGTHIFSKSAWSAAHPGQDVNAAAQYAGTQGYQIAP
jgi:hypothetical protein